MSESALATGEPALAAELREVLLAAGFTGEGVRSALRSGRDVLARLDPRPFDADLMQATAAVAQSEADLARLRVLADDARVKLTRAQILASSELISPADLEIAVVADAGKIYILGGITAERDTVGDVLVYDVETGALREVNA